jgi:hypothetical protein
MAEEGETAERNSQLLQEAFYGGYKKHHGIKFQSVELPNGMCADLFGPKSYRDSDVDLLTASGLVPALFGFPNEANQLAPLRRIVGDTATVSTLVTVVGHP